MKVVAAGDISPEGIGTQKATSDLAIRLSPQAVLALGDNQYPSGNLVDYAAYFAPTWGRLNGITWPSPGNHDPCGPSGYDEYFGIGCFRSFRLGEWQVIQLDSNRSMAKDSRQWTFVKNTLEANPTTCTLAYWHEPRWSSGAEHGSSSKSAAMWSLLFRHRADVVLGGHDHLYERFAKKRPDGSRASNGIRQFVSGLGGKSRYGFGRTVQGSQVRYNGGFGVLELTLGQGMYSWRFVTTRDVVVDQGSAGCVS